MKIKEAGAVYRDIISDYSEKRARLQLACSRYRDKISEAKDKGEDYSRYAEDVAVLELSDNALKEKQQEYQKYLDDIMAQWESKLEEVSAKNEAEGAKEQALEMSRLMKVVRRMCKGDIVPGSDEKKLMEYNSKLYMMAKNAQSIARTEKSKKHKSLWEDEEVSEKEDPIQAADDVDAVAGPERTSPEEIAGEALRSLEDFDEVG